jgi:hypothetical protein
MEETVARTASNLVPLLVTLAVIFGVLIVLALVLRSRVRSQPGARPVRQRSSPADLQPGDVLSVLGRAFQVEAVEILEGRGGPALWCVLHADDGSGRTALARDLSWAVHFPGQSPGPSDPLFPERIERQEGDYQRADDPVQLGQGWRVARYRGAAGRWLAIEERVGERTLWRGKEIPVEGVTVLEEQES